MQLKFDISFVIYGYLFICLMLMAFNIGYIFYSSHTKKSIHRNAELWIKKIKAQIERTEKKQGIEASHTELIQKKLSNTNQLVAYMRALEAIREMGIDTTAYLQRLYLPFQELSYAYGKKESPEKAFFAFFIAENPPYCGDAHRPIMEILISYLEGSTVYGRENILKAFYAMGNVQSVITTMDWIESRGMVHHQKLLADGLMTFCGDKKVLADALWQRRMSYSVSTTVAIVQFISNTLDNYSEIFYEELQRTDIDIEIRIAILRYFQRHHYEPVGAMLTAMETGTENADENLLIVATSVLANYPSEETKAALRKALCHRNWYVRKNAAASLVRITEDKSELDSILNGDDRYAREILEYMLEETEKGGKQ